MSGEQPSTARKAAGGGRRVGAVLALLLLVSAAAEARPYVLEWNANTDGITAGYRVYQNSSAVCNPLEGTDVGGTTFALNLTPGATYHFFVCAYDSLDQFGPPSAVLQFTVPNTAPVLTNPGTQANAPGNVVSLPLVATDANGDGLIFTSVTGLPPGLTANASGQITGTLAAGSAGVYTVTATVSDGGAQDVEVFIWRVISFAASPNAVLSGGHVAAIIANAPGAATDYVTLAVAGSANNSFVSKKYLNGLATPPGVGMTDAVVTFDVGGGSGNHELRFFRNDTTTLFAMAPVTVTANQAPQVTAISNRTDPAGLAVSLAVTATDPDGSYAQAVLAASPTAYWRLGEGGGTSAIDASGNGRTGTYTSGPTLGVAGAVPGGDTAVQFDGANDHVVVTGMPAMPTQATLEAWVYSTSIATSQILVSGGSSGLNYVGLLSSKALASFVVNGAQATVSGATTLLPNTWYHLAVTFDGATIKVYVNGVLDGQVASAGALTWAAASTVNIGRLTGGTNHVVGKLDEVAIYNTALTAAQVLAHRESRTLGYSATNLPPGVTINPATGLISGTPTTAGVYNVTVTVNDGFTSTPVVFTWTVNQPPQVTAIANRTDPLGLAVNQAVTATDPDGSTLSYSAANLPPGVTINPATGLISGSPTTPGVYNVTVTVNDGFSSTPVIFTWTIASNQPPQVTAIANRTDPLGLAVNQAVTATDPDGSTLSYSATNLPPGVTINPATGLISGSPTTVGVYNVTVTVNDGSTSTPVLFTWTVASNQPPQVTAIANRTDAAGGAVNLAVTATDPDGSYAQAVLAASPTAYWRLGEPSGASAADSSGNGRTGTYTNGPTLGVAGAVPGGDTAVQFDGANDHVVVTGMPAMPTHGTLEAWVYSTSIATDQILIAGGWVNYVRIVNAKAFASLAVNGGQRTVSGATTLLSNTWYHLAVTFDGATIKVYVNGVLDGSTPAVGSLTWAAASTVNIGRYTGGTHHVGGKLDEVAIYNTALTAAQVLAHRESRTLSYSATNLPPGITINLATGAINGTPTTLGVYNVTVTVSDGVTSTPVLFTWTVVSNQPPQVTPIPNRTDAAGLAVTLAVTATDPDGYAQAVLAASPTAYWRLGEPSGASAADSSGNGRTGTYTNGPTLGVSGAVPGGDTAVQFDGTNDHVVVTGLPAMPTQGTLEAWVYSTSIATDQILVAGGWVNYLRIVNARAFASLGVNGGQRTVSGATTLLSNTWYHLAVTFDGATIKVYVNGVLDGSTAAVGSLTWAAASTVNIGRYSGGTHHFVGKLDEVAIYNTALTAAQVLAHHQNRTLSYSATNLPPGVTINPATGAISGTPTTLGVYNVTVMVSDGVSTTQTSFNWTILANQAPAITPINNQNGANGVPVVLGVTASDPDGGYAAAIQTTLPQAYWRLNESSGTGAVDSSGHGRSGTFTNGVTLGAAGALGDATTAASFDGVNDYVAAPNLNLTGSFTLEAWVYYTGPGSTGSTSYGTLFGAADNRRILVHESGQLLAQVGGNNFVATALAPPNTWTHVVYRYDAALNQQAFFVNGAAAGTSTPTTAPTWNATFRLGDSGVGNYLFKGRLDEVAVHDAALTAAQIAAHFAGQTLSYSATGLPPGLTINAVTGVISGTPTANGVFPVTITVSDGISSSQELFDWTIGSD